MRRIANTGGSQATRRTVLQSAGVLAAGLLPGPATAGARDETLAISGGPPAVNVPERQHAGASRWPIFGAEEEAAVLDLLRNPGYGPIAALEREWKDYFGVPHVKAHCNGTS